MTFLSLPIVIDAVAKASVILGATALAAASLRRASASARHLVWTLGLLSALAAPALSVALPRWELPIVRVSAPAPAAVARDAGVSRQAPTLSHIASTSATATPSPVDVDRLGSQIMTPSGTPISWRAVLLFAWIAGALVILGRMFLGLAAVQWMSRRMPVVADAPWLPQAQALARDLGLRRVRFLRTAVSTMPMAWGIFRSSVLMPADADGWPAHRLRVVLLHELAHVKRRDCLTHLVAQVACAAYWFNPLAWMAARRLRTERERACDDLVLASGTRGSDYADQLLDIARVMRAGRFPAVLGGASLAMAQRSQLEGRLMAILDPSVPRRGVTRVRATAAATLFALMIVPVASVQPWAEERSSSSPSNTDEAAAVGATTADQAQPSQPARAQDTQTPIESYPGQAAADNRANAKNQDVIQGVVQGNVQGMTQGMVQGQLQRGIQEGIANGVPRGVAGGVTGGMVDGISSTVGSVVGGIVGGMAEGIASGVAGGVAGGVSHDKGVDHSLDRSQDQNRDRDRDHDGDKGHAFDPRTVNALVEALKDTDKEVRQTAMSALVQMRDPRIFDPLVAALKDASADVREQAAFGLGQIRDVRAIEPLASVLKDQSADVREQAVFALGQLRAAAAIDAITTALHDSSADVREQAAFALGQIRDRRAVEPLISALKDAKPDVREQAAFALGQLRDAKAVEALVIALKDADADVREQSAFALGQLRDSRAIDGLTAALKDVSASVRQQAAFALGQIR